MSPPSNPTLTAIAGLRVGHAVMAGRPTGCTVILADGGAVASVDVRGGGPATKETDLLDPVNLVPVVHAICLSGGSAFGLDAASGVMRFLEEAGIGFDVGVARVPIVPAASLFDLAFGGDARIRPDADCGYRAAAGATAAPVMEGNVGAGAGASVGKLAGMERAMKAGLGSAALTVAGPGCPEGPAGSAGPGASGASGGAGTAGGVDEGLIVAALVAVNAVGDVVDPATARPLAGARGADGRGLADSRVLLRQRAEAGAGSGSADRQGTGSGQNTTLAVVATNATLTKAQARKLAQMAQDGLARAIQPVHTPLDGDTVFALATGRRPGEVDLTVLGALAADVIALAIVRAATEARGLGGLPAACDLDR